MVLPIRLWCLIYDVLPCSVGIGWKWSWFRVREEENFSDGDLSVMEERKERLCVRRLVL